MLENPKELPLPPILLKLVEFENEDLVQGSLQLLNKLYSSDINLFQRAAQAQLLITEMSKDFYAKIEESLYSLRESLNPKLSLLLQGAQTDPPSDGMHSLELMDLTRSCWLPGEVEGYEPHQQNQSIIYNFG